MHCGLADLEQRERYKHTITILAFVLRPQNILRLYNVTITPHDSYRKVRIFM